MYVHIYSTIHKWENDFYEMKEDVGMSLHEKGNKRQQRKSFTAPSLPV